MGQSFAPVLKSRYGQIFLLVAALFLALIGYQMFASWQSARATAQTTVQNLALVLERDLRTEFEAAERVVDTLAANIDPDAMHQASVRRHKTQVIRWLRSLAPNVSMMESLRVFDARGDLLYGSEEGTPRRNIAERPYFHKFQADPASPGVYYQTVISGLTGHALLLRANPIRDAKGAFLGIASVAINLSALREHFAKIDIGPGGAVLLSRFDNGALIVRFPGPVNVDNKPAPDNELRQAILQRGPNGTIEYISSFDGVKRIHGYRMIGANIPFYVATGIAESDYLAGWRRDSALLAGAALFFLGILALAFYFLARVQAQERRRTQELRDSGDSLRHVLETTLDGYLYADGQGRLLEVNPSYCRQSGYTREELIGMHISDLDATEDASDIEARIARLVKNGSDQFETLHRRKDGSLWHVEVSTTFRNIADRQLAAFVRDITARKRSEDQLKHAKQAAEAANIAKSQFLATMSHEIRTPMNGILGMAQVLLMPGVSEAERLDYARTILGSGQTLLALLNDILDLSRIEAGKVELESIALEPGQIIRETQGLFAEIARAKGLRIETDWSGAPRRYTGDPHRLRQMLSNLVGNAIKFTAQGQIRIEARELERTGQAAVLEFSVIDSGVGIAQDKQVLLFQPFSQVDSSITRNYGGTGLGLSIVTQLARLMGGEVGLESEVGRGSRFWFRIRAGLDAADNDRPAPSPGTAAAPGALAAQLSGRVLVVEDNPFSQKVIKILLDKLGLSSALAEDGQQAVDAIARSEAVDLVLMDVQMPHMDGYAATRRIRQWEAETGAPRRPIVALTAEAFQQDRQHCLDAGMDEVLTKPIDFEAMRAVLGKWLPAVPGAEAPPAAQVKPADIPRVVALVDEIMPLLAQNRFDAITRFRELQQVTAGTSIAAEIGEIGPMLEQVRFDLAQDHLQRMAATHGWGVAARN